MTDAKEKEAPPKKMSRYQVVECPITQYGHLGYGGISANLDKFEDEVSGLLDQGYVLHGPPTTCLSNGGGLIIQALYKPSPA